MNKEQLNDKTLMELQEIAKEVAKKLGIIYVDTGALYRTIGLYMLNNGINPKDAPSVAVESPKRLSATDAIKMPTIIIINIKEVPQRGWKREYLAAFSGVSSTTPVIINAQPTFSFAISS